MLGRMSKSHKCWQNQQGYTQEKLRSSRLHELRRKSLQSPTLEDSKSVHLSLRTRMFHAMFGFGISWTDGSSSEKGEKTAIVLLPFRRRGQWTDGRRRRIESARGQQLLRRNALQFVRRSVRPSVRPSAEPVHREQGGKLLPILPR